MRSADSPLLVLLQRIHHGYPPQINNCCYQVWNCYCWLSPTVCHISDVVLFCSWAVFAEIQDMLNILWHSLHFHICSPSIMNCMVRGTFLTPMWLLCSCGSACYFRKSRIMILWPFIVTSSIMAKSSQNAQFWHNSCFASILKFLSSMHLSLAIQLNVGYFSDSLLVLGPALPVIPPVALPSTVSFMSLWLCLLTFWPRWLILWLPLSLFTCHFLTLLMSNLSENSFCLLTLNNVTCHSENDTNGSF